MGFGRTTKYTPTEHGIENATENAKGKKESHGGNAGGGQGRNARRREGGGSRRGGGEGAQKKRQGEGVEERNVKGV